MIFRGGLASVTFQYSAVCLTSRTLPASGGLVADGTPTSRPRELRGWLLREAPRARQQDEAASSSATVLLWATESP